MRDSEPLPRHPPQPPLKTACRTQTQTQTLTLSSRIPEPSDGHLHLHIPVPESLIAPPCPGGSWMARVLTPDPDPSLGSRGSPRRSTAPHSQASSLHRPPASPLTTRPDLVSSLYTGSQIPTHWWIPESDFPPTLPVTGSPRSATGFWIFKRPRSPDPINAMSKSRNVPSPWVPGSPSPPPLDPQIP